MESLSMQIFPDPGNLFPLIRTAIWACQLTSTKHQDGFAKLLTRSDIQRLASQQGMAATTTAESMLSDSWKLVQSQLPAEGTTATNSSTNHLFKCYGKFCVRAILFLTKKEKFAPDQQKFQTLADILDRFTQDVANVSLGMASSTLEATTCQLQPLVMADHTGSVLGTEMAFPLGSMVPCSRHLKNAVVWLLARERNPHCPIVYALYLYLRKYFTE